MPSELEHGGVGNFGVDTGEKLAVLIQLRSGKTVSVLHQADRKPFWRIRSEQ